MKNRPRLFQVGWQQVPYLTLILISIQVEVNMCLSERKGGKRSWEKEIARRSGYMSESIRLSMGAVAPKLRDSSIIPHELLMSNWARTWVGNCTTERQARRTKMRKKLRTNGSKSSPNRHNDVSDKKYKSWYVVMSICRRNDRRRQKHEKMFLSRPSEVESQVTPVFTHKLPDEYLLLLSNKHGQNSRGWWLFLPTLCKSNIYN